MGAVKGRTHRTGVADAVQLNVRVHADRKRKVERIADALGVSVNAYMDSLLAREQVDDAGRPLWWADPVPRDQEELLKREDVA